METLPAFMLEIRWERRVARGKTLEYLLLRGDLERSARHISTNTKTDSIPIRLVLYFLLAVLIDEVTEVLMNSKTSLR